MDRVSVQAIMNNVFCVDPSISHAVCGGSMLNLEILNDELLSVALRPLIRVWYGPHGITFRNTSGYRILRDMIVCQLLAFDAGLAKPWPDNDWKSIPFANAPTI